ncbi:glycine betaine ABC transporter substrate-binding protein [Sedimentisphaera salicampi]|uniref:Glycine betaine/carnitine transport binding protein GbuC n=1 Tax=Sedimentisphaera salicampi TaxID=1941349 RepID=A0A1W6LLZ7_9BACT|nr:glycine betaine ABC transporter substrate-binding protein [Sedimentisphaera salicampi]ARN56820.1 Glycine betaine/carnitine transport binding protein GbuC precursor [Sedimentisphaera salicampi]OXU14997.1 Glycine betaine/carnitine transport binding protein GbuC precursor [Sedimentisphaera salicampi]
MKKRLISVMVISFLAAALTAFTGCKKQTPAQDDGQQAQQQESSEGSKEIKLSYGNWAEGVAFAHLMEVMLTDMGYDVQMTLADLGPLFASVAEGNQDIMVESWMPATHGHYWEQYGEDFDELVTWFDTAKIGLVVPDYVKIDSVADLNQIKEGIKGQITGIDAGAGIMKKTKQAIQDYNLDLELLTSSGPAMTASLKSAIDKKEPIVVTGWAPHWKFARYDLKFLEDPKGVYGSTERVVAICRKGFKQDMPEVAEFFSKIKFNTAQIGSLMDVMANADDKEEAARQWMMDNPALVATWTTVQ